ncbi:MAG: TetR/AcrR family transcriptional regulator [Bacteroidetes bacterium]|nr:TetR/AcrR family transcriptional regulator [Bacteroidota bacterium]
MNVSKEEEVKIAILESAKRVFQKWGLNKSTMEDIANEAGKGKSTLYYYYKSKDEIFEVLATHEMNIIFNKVKNLIGAISSPKEKLKKYIASILIEIKDTVSIYPLVKGEIIGNRELIEKIRKQIDDNEEALIVEILKEGFISGDFSFLRESELNKAANVIVGIIRGLELYLFLDNEDNEKIDIATKIIANGV